MVKDKSSGGVVILVKESYLARIHGAAGTRMFRTLYALVDGEKKDILNQGDKSCSLFVSSVLLSFALVKAVHVTVRGTVTDMESFGWARIRNPRAGCVVVWNAVNERGEEHEHIGFYIGSGTAVSNSSKKGVPHVHSYRAHTVKSLYWTSKLD